MALARSTVDTMLGETSTFPYYSKGRRPRESDFGHRYIRDGGYSRILCGINICTPGTIYGKQQQQQPFEKRSP